MPMQLSSHLKSAAECSEISYSVMTTERKVNIHVMKIGSTQKTNWLHFQLINTLVDGNWI